MNRSSPYYPLAYRVDYQGTGRHFFETIAAFNSDRVALAYAADCRKTHPVGDQYRVMERTSKGWKEIK